LGGKSSADSGCLHIESVNTFSLLGPVTEARDEKTEYALIPLSDEHRKPSIRPRCQTSQAFTYQINGVTTIHVDILDTARHVSEGYGSPGKGGFTVGNGTS
jgi:hypothetical protein